MKEQNKDVVNEWFEFIGINWQGSNETEKKLFFKNMDRKILEDHAFMTSFLAYSFADLCDDVSDHLHEFKEFAKKIDEEGLLEAEKYSELVKDLKMAERIIKTQRLKIRNDENRRKQIARNAVLKKLQHDPKQQAKKEIKAEYLEWQVMPEEERNAKYRSAAKFASVMRDTHTDKKSGLPYFDSPRVIERWCTEWKKELKNTHPA